MCTECSFGFCTLFFLCFFESFFVISQTLFFQNLTCQIDRESISIIKLKCVLSRENGLTILLHLFFHVCKNRKSLVNCLVELSFFFSDYVKDKVFLFFQFRISIFRSVNDSLCKFYKECSLNSKKSSMTACTAEKTSQYISTSAV